MVYDPCGSVHLVLYPSGRLRGEVIRYVVKCEMNIRNSQLDLFGCFVEVAWNPKQLETQLLSLDAGENAPQSDYTDGLYL